MCEAELESKIKSLQLYIKEQDVLMRNGRSGSVPALDDVIDEAQYLMLVDYCFPVELREDEKTVEYLNKLIAIGSCSMVPVEKYKTNKIKIRHRCVVCGYESNLTPSCILTNAKKHRRGCSGCNHKNGTSLEDARILFEVKQTGITPLSGFESAQDKVLMQCNICGHEWETRPYYIVNGYSGCPNCANKRNGNRNRKTTEQFVEELHSINPDIEVLGEYVTSKTKIKVRNKKCQHEWETTPQGLLIGHDCPECACKRRKPISGKRKTHEQFLKEMKELHPDMIVLGKYQTGRTKIRVKHIPCGCEFDIEPQSLLSGSGCSKCNNERSHNEQRKTHVQFVEEVNEIHSGIEILTEYVNSNTKVLAKHTCGHEWYVKPSKLLVGQGCPKCNKRPKITDETYKKKLQEQNIKYIPLEPTQNVDTKIKHLCPECNKTWEVSPYNILFGYGCPKCNAGRESYKEVLENLNKYAPTVKLVGEYKGKNKKALFKCKDCNYEWHVMPYNILHGAGCPRCNSKKSFPENALFYYLSRDSENQVLHNAKIIIPELDIDFYCDIFIPALKLFVEYDGIAWHCDNTVEQRYKKREEAIYKSGFWCLHMVETKRNNKMNIDISWMKDVPIDVDVHGGTQKLRQQFDEAYLELLDRINIKPKDIVNCYNDRIQIDELYYQESKKYIVVIDKNSFHLMLRKNNT